jgi:DNA-directed RNA polymerase beta subunit
MDDITNIPLEKFEGNHNFLAEELLVPNVNKCDSNRVNMFCSHLPQSVVLINGEFPKVFTNFENQVGKYSSGYKKSDRKWKVIAKIIKNNMNYILVIKDEKGYIDIIERKPCERITESYAYGIKNNYIDKKKVKDEIEKDSILHKSTAYDDDMNFNFGINLRAVYIPWENMTFEDAIVISESASKKLSSHSVDEIVININTNDVLCNIYKDARDERGNFVYGGYKTFPDIGEYVQNKILVSRRRINYDSAFYDMSAKNLSKINYNTDTNFYSEGMVVDIDVFCNADIEKLNDYNYNKQIVRYLKGNISYYEKIVRVLRPFIETKKRNYSDNAAYLYKRAKDIIDPEVRWRNDKSDFDNLIVKFKILRVQNLQIGSKITNRYGGKGVISMVLPDNEMPVTENGERPEILLNPLGIINRLNIAQLYEHELNFMGNRLIESMKNKSLEDKEEMLFNFIYTVNEEQYDKLVDYYNSLNKNERLDFFKSIDEKGIYIHQPPFFGNITLEKMALLYKEHKDIFKPYKFKNIMNPLIMGDMYFMKLKHEPKGKFSARSSSYMSQKNLPAKSTKFKEHQQLYPKTPIKIGEMENANIMIGNNMEIVNDFRSMYSTNEDYRHASFVDQLTKNVFNLEKIEHPGTSSMIKDIIDVYLSVISLKLVNKEDEET